MSKASRVAFADRILELGKDNEDIVVMDADLGKSTYSIKFGTAFPDRYFQMGVAESNMIGCGAGLALCGKTVYICSFSCFVTGRYDTIRMSLAYTNTNVRIIGTHAGIAIGPDGNSQQGLEDIAIMRSLPNMSVIQPADELETVAAIDYSVIHKGPMFIRLTRQNLEEVHSSDYKFSFGKGDLLKDGKDITIFATGGVVYNALQAAYALESSGISARIVNIHTLKPIDEELIIRCAKETKYLMTVEDHNSSGGLGSAVSDVVSSNYPVLVRRLGLGDSFGESGDQSSLYKKFGLDTDGIKSSAISFLKEGNKVLV